MHVINGRLLIMRSSNDLKIKNFFVNIIVPVATTILIFAIILIYYDQDINFKQIFISQNNSIFSYTKSNNKIPNFSQITDISMKKKLFFDFMRPAIEAENAIILLKRKKLIGIFNKKFISINEIKEIRGIASEYKIDDFDIMSSSTREKLLSRVDIIPVPLALVQSANETAWGTSRFAKLGNNMFGQWSFTKGEGIIPERRDIGATHEIAIFDSVNKSVSSYMQNLNTGKSYDSLRKLRLSMRKENKDLEAITLAGGLTKYSSLGQKYVNIICSMLKSNEKYM